MNDWPLDLVARFWERDGGVCMLADEYEGLGFSLEEAYVSTSGSVREVCLQNVPGLTWRLDLRAQTILIQAPFDRLKRVRLQVGAPIPRVESAASYGGLLAYDAYGDYTAEKENFYGARLLTTNLTARFYTPSFTAETTGYVTLSEGAEPALVRLDSWVEFDDPDKVRRLRVGDSYTTGLEWVQPVRFAGIHWGTDYAIRPDIITTPTLDIEENLGAPSTIDLFINNVHRFSDNAEPGAFELTDLPTMTGTNTVRVVVTEQSGRTRVRELPLYASPRLLAPDVALYNVFAGVSRKDYAIKSNEYDDGFFSANYRRGFEGSFTLGSEINLASEYASASFGGTKVVADRFMVFGGLSVSGSEAGTGLAWLAGLERVGRWTNFSARYQRADDRYRDLGARLGYISTVELGLVTAGVTFERAGNLNFSYAVQRNAFQPRTQIATASYTIDLFDRRASLFVSGYADLDSDNWGGNISLIFPLGRNTRGNVDAHRSQSDSYYAVEARGDAYDQRLNWAVVAAQGQFDGGYIEADWDGQAIDAGARAISVNGRHEIEVTAAQSFVVMPEGMFVAGRIDDGFTLVKVDDYPGVEVFLENRPVGRTDRRGNLLVTDLESYVGNALSIDSQDLPIDVQVERTTALVAPRLGAGAVTRFDVAKERALLISLRLPDGKPPPVGAIAALAGSDRLAPVGYDGDVYLRGVEQGRNQIEVTWSGGRCSAVVSGQIEPGRLRKAGAVTCEP